MAGRNGLIYAVISEVISLHATTIIGKVQRTLRAAGQPERAEAFVTRAFQAKSYDEVLVLCLEYVDVH